MMIKEIGLTQWNSFLRDWGGAGHHGDCHAQRGQLSTRAMFAVLQCQQRAAEELKGRGLSKPCREFTARFRTPTWQTTADDIKMSRIAQGVEYVYAANGRMCFNGKLIGMGDQDHGQARFGNFIKLDRSLFHRKLNQFKSAFPEVTFFWIALSSVVVAHFLWHGRKEGEAGACLQGLSLLSQSVQFDQPAIESIFHEPADVCDVAYAIRHLEVGKYGTFTLSVLAADVVLMRIELGLLQKVPRAAEVDILID